MRWCVGAFQPFFLMRMLAFSHPPCTAGQLCSPFHHGKTTRVCTLCKPLYITALNNAPFGRLQNESVSIRSRLCHKRQPCGRRTLHYSPEAYPSQRLSETLSCQGVAFVQAKHVVIPSCSGNTAREPASILGMLTFQTLPRSVNENDGNGFCSHMARGVQCSRWLFGRTVTPVLQQTASPPAHRRWEL